MRIHTETDGQFIQALALSISKDPASLENWRCLYVGHAGDLTCEWYEKILDSLKHVHKDLDCDVVHYNNNDLLFISRHWHAEELYAVADALLNAAALHHEATGEVALYDLFRDWREVKELLIARAGVPEALPNKLPTYDFGEVASLAEVFSTAKKLRDARQPLHVMLVEDDPLTRRIVANTFKDNYALITASTAQEAVENYLLHAPDIVFLDIGLPDASGFDVLQQIMVTDRDAYVVMFSANSYLDNVTTALAGGASGFVGKPFNKDKMRHYIHDSATHHGKDGE